MHNFTQSRDQQEGSPAVSRVLVVRRLKMHTSVRTFCPSALGFASAIAGHRVVVMPAPQSAALEGRAYHLGCGISWLGCVSRWDQLPVFVSQSLTTHIQ